VGFSTPDGLLPAVRDLSFELRPGERLALVGESGSGKSTVFGAILGLLPASAVVRGRAVMDGQDLLTLGEAGLRRFRGRRIGLVVQDPHQGLEPNRRVGRQIKEALLIHRMCGQGEADRRVAGLLEEVGLSDTARVGASYPHQLSGGMAQRAMVAMMLAAEPAVLVADEATSALDAPLRRALLELIDRERRQRGLAVVLISHDLELVADFADRVLVMYGGRVVESVEGRLIGRARHPYTLGLLACRPRPGGAGRPLATLVRDQAWLA
jgi:peptide/nickel transport system ATP-binding protein